MRRNEKGFSLVELLITISITGVLFSVIAAVIFQMSTVSGSGNDKLTVWHELQNASNQFEKDGQSALTASGSGSLILTYASGETVVYALNGSSLERTAGTATRVLAQNIETLNFSVSGRLVSMDIRSTVPGRTSNSEQITSTVNLRTSAP